MDFYTVRSRAADQHQKSMKKLLLHLSHKHPYYTNAFSILFARIQHPLTPRFSELIFGTYFAINCHYQPYLTSCLVTLEQEPRHTAGGGYVPLEAVYFLGTFTASNTPPMHASLHILRTCVYICITRCPCAACKHMFRSLNQQHVPITMTTRHSPKQTSRRRFPQLRPFQRPRPFQTRAAAQQSRCNCARGR